MPLAGKTSYSVGASEKQIMRELYENGPAEGAFLVYEDFLQYKSGERCSSNSLRFIAW